MLNIESKHERIISEPSELNRARHSATVNKTETKNCRLKSVTHNVRNHILNHYSIMYNVVTDTY